MVEGLILIWENINLIVIRSRDQFLMKSKLKLKDSLNLRSAPSKSEAFLQNNK